MPGKCGFHTLRAMALLLVFNAGAQKQAPNPERANTDRLSASLEGEEVREIDDPHTGDRWILTRNAAHPEAPGSLQLVVVAHRPRNGTTANAKTAQPGPAPAVPMIRSGDRVIVEENTATVEARLEAVAMTAAGAGGILRLRLTIGGQIVKATARAPGRAELVERQP